MQAAAAALASWSKEWQVDNPAKQGGEHPWQTYKVDLPKLEPGSLVAVGRRYKEHTGVGADRVHPRLAALLSRKGEQAFLEYIHLMETTRLWPEHSQWLLYFLIEKENDSDRPIWAHEHLGPMVGAASRTTCAAMEVAVCQGMGCSRLWHRRSRSSSVGSLAVP